MKVLLKCDNFKVVKLGVQKLVNLTGVELQSIFGPDLIC